MQQIFKTLDDGYIKYKNHTIVVIIDNDEMIYFNAGETAIALGYSNYLKAIKQHTKQKDRMYLRDIKTDNKYGHPQTIYFTEPGLYKFILRSNMPNAEQFSDWVTYDVLPSIRKYGHYQLTKEYEHTIKKLNIQIKCLATKKKNADKEIIILKQNLKKEQFPKGGLVYAIDFSTPKKEIYRIGRTTNMKRRKEVTDTHTLNRHPVAFYIASKCPPATEKCIQSLLYQFRSRDNKDFYICSFKQIKFAFNSCINNSQKINCPNKSGSKSAKQKGGANILPNTNIISREISNAQNTIIHFNKKIDKLNKLIYGY